MNLPKKRYLWVGGVVVTVALGLGWYFFVRGSVTAPPNGMVVAEVSKGTVSTGIKATGKIEAAEVLDLNVYKRAARIHTVNMANGTHVEEGELLLAFDESDAVVDIASSQLAIEKARLALEEEKLNAADPNTQVTSLKNDIVTLKQNLVQYDVDRRQLLRDYLSSNLYAEPTPERYDEQVVKSKPTISGVYNGTAEGVYTIAIYASNGESGYSYNLSGLENGTFVLYPGKSVPLGTRGLMITFPSDIRARDTWLVAVPNTYAPEYKKNKETYVNNSADLDEKEAADRVSLQNKTVQLAQTERGDTGATRSLSVEEKALAIRQAQVNLQKGIDARDERRIIAPFSGTVEGIENVVVGATPSRDTTDTTNFGSLISDEFLVTFSLSAADIDRVQIGQKVLVTLTSVPGARPLEGTVTEKSSLPNTGAVAEYEVRARMEPAEHTRVTLRDGMLADIEIVQQEKTDVLRVPVSALTYVDGTPTVTVIEGLSEEDRNAALRQGVVEAASSTYRTYSRTVEVGLRGSYFVEIANGLSEGELIVVTSVADTAAAASSVRTGFGVGGGRRPPDESDSSNSSSRSTGG